MGKARWCEKKQRYAGEWRIYGSSFTRETDDCGAESGACVVFDQTDLKGIGLLFLGSMMASNPSLSPEIGPDGLLREAPVIAYTEKIIEAEQNQLKKYGWNTTLLFIVRILSEFP